MKGLAASQRRLGPSFHGWFGLLQIVADGLKLIGKDSSLWGFNRATSSGCEYQFLTLIVPALWFFVWSYFIFCVWWSSGSLGVSIPFVFLLFFFLQGTALCGLVLCKCLYSELVKERTAFSFYRVATRNDRFIMVCYSWFEEISVYAELLNIFL